MKTQGLLAVFVLVALGSVSVHAKGRVNCAPAVPVDVCSLEDKIYTGTDFKSTQEVRAVMVGLKQLLMAHVSDSSVVQDHIVGLVEHVVEEAHEARAPREILAEAEGQPNLVSIHEKLAKYETQKGPIVPLDWALPDDIQYFVFNTMRHYNPVKDRTEFDFGIFGILNQPGSIEQVQVIRYPNEVVLDRQAGIGDWTEGHLDTSEPIIQFGAESQPVGQKEGLYLLNVKARGKPMVNGWFVLSRTTASASVVVRSPSPGEVYRTGAPTFRWSDFKSPEFKPFNQRKRMLGIHWRGAGIHEGLWHTSEVYPNSSESDRVNGLENGSYAFKAQFEERWFFGSLLIGRGATTEIPFSVSK
jgi:hypothetical protein